MKILLLADENDRAAMACVRSFKIHKINYIIGYKHNKFFKKRMIFNYNNNVAYYTIEDEKSFVNSIVNIRKKFGPLQIFLFGDKASLWLIKNKDFFETIDIFINGPSLDNYKSMLNKESFLTTAKSYGLLEPTNQNNLIKSKEFHEKFVIKAKTNTEGLSNILATPLLIENQQNLTDLFNENLNFEGHIIQKYIVGPSIYYSAVYRNGEKITSFSQKNLKQQPGGKSVIKSEPYNFSKSISEKIDKMMSDLDWTGPMMIEFKKENNEYYLIECNPRLWGPLQLAIDNGIDYPLILSKIDNYLIPKEYLNESKSAIGYIWLNGYILGWLYKLKTKTKFQTFESNYNKLKFKDIWYRFDSLLYGIMEIPSLVINRFLK